MERTDPMSSGRRLRPMVGAAALAAIGLLAPAELTAEPLAPDAREGLVFARDVCSECHDVEARGASKSARYAPPFAVIARNPALDDAALRAFFQISHPLMPDFVFVLDGERDEDLVAYFRHLRQTADAEATPSED